MSAARPLSLLSAGAVVALTLATPGTALAEPGHEAGSKKGQGAAHGKDAPKGEPAGPAGPSGSSGEKPASSRPAAATPSGSAQGKAAKDNRAEGNRAKDNRARDNRADKPATQPAATTGDAAAQTTSGDPAGNNGTIKIDTVPGDPHRANRPHPGCAFVVQFFGFDADQRADITFTGQAPTASSGPLLTLSDQLISTTPADAALEEGHSLTLTAADLGLLDTPTAAKGWHVKVAVDALEAPGGAKQKVFWLDCASGAADVTQENENDAAAAGAADESAAGAADASAAGSAVEQAAADRRLEGFGDEVAVLSGSADRDAVGQGRAGDSAAVRSQDAAQGRSTTSTLASVLPFAVPAALPFTGAAGVTGMLAAGLAAVAAGALALRAGRRRTTVASHSAVD